MQYRQQNLHQFIQNQLPLALTLPIVEIKKIIVSKVKNIPKVTSCQSASCDDEFFERAFAKKSRKDIPSEMLLDDFLKHAHECQSREIATLLCNEVGELLV